MNASPRSRSALLPLLAGLGSPGSGPAATIAAPRGSGATLRRLLAAAPCLYAQLATTISARAVVHLCEVTLRTRIDSRNVYQAFRIQHPRLAPGFAIPPGKTGASGGDIMEALCTEVLTNHGVPHMTRGPDGWPAWASRSHVSLNHGRFRELKLYGDILIPAAPHNLLVSVKSEAARERFVVSGNRLDSVGFGFFSSPHEFWTATRISLLRRWGFVAIYMPAATLSGVEARLKSDGREANNINGRALFRPLEDFGEDMARVAGRLTVDL